jgi:two-component system, response regulator PdtaR
MPDQTFVLVAEDEELVRLVIVQVLLDEGFEVLEAEHAEAALIVLESHARRIHVLFTDIQMPGTMDGLALAHHASKHWPWIGLLVTSARPRSDGTAFPEQSRCPRHRLWRMARRIVPLQCSFAFARAANSEEA